LLLVSDPNLQHSFSVSLELISIISGDLEVLITLTMLLESRQSLSFSPPQISYPSLSAEILDMSISYPLYQLVTLG